MLSNRVPGNPRVIYLSPQGKTFNQTMAEEFAQEEDLVFLCGHYEGIDERVLNEVVTDYVSIGDYVLTGGELPAMIMIDAISRLVPGVLHNDVSAEFRAFRIIFLSTLSIPGRRSGTISRCQPYFCPVIMRI